MFFLAFENPLICGKIFPHTLSYFGCFQLFQSTSLSCFNLHGFLFLLQFTYSCALLYFRSNFQFFSIFLFFLTLQQSLISPNYVVFHLLLMNSLIPGAIFIVFFLLYFTISYFLLQFTYLWTLLNIRVPRLCWFLLHLEQHQMAGEVSILFNFIVYE